MRIYPNEQGHLDLTPGTYGQDKDGKWWVCTPSGYAGPLIEHTVTEHADRSITVMPSILTPMGPENQHYYHGFLVNGQWKSCD
jgi:hypothetical protein